MSTPSTSSTPEAPLTADPSPTHEQLAAVRALVGRLLAERSKIMDTMIALVNAAAPFRHQWVRIKGEPEISLAWANAHAMCELWTRLNDASTKQLPAPPAAHTTSEGVYLAERK